MLSTDIEACNGRIGSLIRPLVFGPLSGKGCLVRVHSGMQVHRALATVGGVTLSSIIVLAVAAVAIMGANVGWKMSAGSLPSTTPLAAGPEDLSAEDRSAEAVPLVTAAEVLAARFPSEDAVAQPPTFSTASVIPAAPGETFDPSAVSGMATVEPPWPAANGIAPLAGTTVEPELPLPEPAKPPAGVASPRRSSARSPNVVNDAMIASIRQRLKLTAEQQKLWPPVEAALRKIVYTRAAMNPQRGQGATAYIDATSPEVQELKSAALPLLMRLNGEQKREVKELVFVMGLEAIASQF
jgi:hypothetical protein